MSKISIRFFDNKEERAVCVEGNAKWWFFVVDIVDILSQIADALCAMRVSFVFVERNCAFEKNK